MAITTMMLAIYAIISFILTVLVIRFVPKWVFRFDISWRIAFVTALAIVVLVGMFMQLAVSVTV